MRPKLLILRGQRERNVIIFEMSEEGDSEGDKNLLKELFKFVGAEEDEFKFQRLGKKKVDDKIRPIKVEFKEVGQKRKFLSLLHKLAKAPQKLKKIRIHHDLSSSEREHLSSLLKKVKEMNKDPNKPVGLTYKVRGPPFAFTIRKFFSEENS